MATIELDPLNKTAIHVADLHGRTLQTTANVEGFAELADLVRRALTSREGVDAVAEEPRGKFPVYFEVPDKEVEGRIRRGAISPENTHYDALKAHFSPFIDFPKEVSQKVIDDTAFPEELKKHPLYTQAKERLEVFLEKAARELSHVIYHDAFTEQQSETYAKAKANPVRAIEKIIRGLENERSQDGAGR
jgi:hypothetical protein